MLVATPERLSDDPTSTCQLGRAVGMSMGGEEAIAAAGADPRIQAVVAEGVTGAQPADHGGLPDRVDGWIQRGIDRIMYGAAGVLSGAPWPMALRMRSGRPRLARCS